MDYYRISNFTVHPSVQEPIHKNAINLYATINLCLVHFPSFPISIIQTVNVSSQIQQTINYFLPKHYNSDALLQSPEMVIPEVPIKFFRHNSFSFK